MCIGMELRPGILVGSAQSLKFACNWFVVGLYFYDIFYKPMSFIIVHAQMHHARCTHT